MEAPVRPSLGAIVRARLAMIAVALLAGGCERDREPERAVAVVMARDQDGALRLFTVVPGSAPRSLAATDDLVITDAVVSTAGTAIALVTRGSAGRELRRLRVPGGLEPAPLDHFARTSGTLAAISDDGRVIVVRGSRTLAVLRDGAPVRTIETYALGTLSYGLALSGDGHRLAFSTMRTDCAFEPTKMATCPVTLWGVDLAGDAAPVAIAAPADNVAYDPSFVGDGRELLYLTSADDDRAACREHVNQCRYSTHQIRFDGTGDRMVRDDAVLARRAPDGMLSFRRTLLDAAGKRSWGTQQLFLATPAGSTIEGPELALGTDRWSPDSRWLLVTRTDSALIVGRDGAPVGAAIEGKQLRAIGWLQRELATGTHALEVPRSPLDHAVMVARERTGSVDRVAVVGTSESSLLPPPKRLPADHYEIDEWLARGGTQVVIERSAYCTQQRGRALLHGGIVELAPGLVTLAGPAPLRPSVDGVPVASFDGAQHGGGAFTLMSVVAPASTRPGARFPVTLWWRVEQAARSPWTVFVHLDAKNTRIPGDHPASVCGDATRNGAGSLFEDTFMIEVPPSSPAGRYDLYLGWFQGGTRARLIIGSGDGADRAKVASIEVRP